MLSVRVAGASLGLLLLAGQSGEVTLSFQAAAGRTLVRTLRSVQSQDLVRESTVLDGVELSAGEPDQGAHTEDDWSLTVTDTFESVAGGVPLVVRRRFDELRRQKRWRYSNDDGEESGDVSYESALEGKTVTFERDGPDGEFAASFAAGSKGEDELLSGLSEDLDLRALLPARPVAEGESWSIDAGAFACILYPGGELHLKDGGGEGEDMAPWDALVRANLTGDFTATFAGRSEGGSSCARVDLELDVQTHVERETERSKGRIDARYELSGALTWDLDLGHARSLELHGTVRTTMTSTQRGEAEGETLEMVRQSVYEGEQSFTMHFELQ
jgi:hypothetical protein